MHFLTIMKKFNCICVFTRLLFKLFLLRSQLCQVLCVDFFNHAGGRITETDFILFQVLMIHHRLHLLLVKPQLSLESIVCFGCSSENIQIENIL